MAHFAEINENNEVVRVVVVDNSKIIVNGVESEAAGVSFLKSLYGAETKWVQTSYHGNFRARYASIGFVYDSALDAFYQKKQYNSWVFDQEKKEFVPPVDYPNDGNAYRWDEQTLTWILY